MNRDEAFVNELIGYIFAYPDDDYMTMECLCRKLSKYGLIDKKDGEWIADTPQTETKGVGYCNECKWFRDKQVCGRCRSRNLFAEADTPQTERSE